MDYSRQLKEFNPEDFKLPVHVIGCGATGSWVAMILAKLGVKDIHIWDFDIVEEHNIPNQLFAMSDIGKLKTDACMENMLRCSALEKVTVHYERADKDSMLSGIVFLLTDTMKSRDEIFRKCLKNNLAVPLFIETRTCLEGGRVYALNPSNKSQCTEYAKTLYTDEESAVSECGTSQSMAPTSALISSLAVWQMVKWHKDVEIDNEVLIDAKYNTFLARKF